jgi:F-type H+-transporting ATPase subunit epsilon
MPFQCTVVTPEEQTFDAQATQVILPTHDGLIGILQNRAPILVKLGTGTLRIDLPGGKSLSYLIDSGIAQMKDNKLTVLTELALAPDQIDPEAARAELAEATARTDNAEARRREIARAKAKLALVSK